MVASVIAFVFVILILFILYRTNSFVQIVGIYLLIISANILIGILYISKFSYSQLGLSNTDYMVFNGLSHSKLPFSTIVRLFNTTYFMYMAAAIFFVRYLSSIKRRTAFLLLIPCICMYVYTDPSITHKIFVLLNESLNAFEIGSIFDICNQVCFSLLIIYMIIPIIFVIIQIRRAVIFLKRRDLSILGMCIVIINLFVYYALINGTFKNIMFYNVNMEKLPKVYDLNLNMMVVSILMWLIIIMTIVFVLFFRPFWVMEKSSKRLLGHPNKHQNKNLSMILHMYKNAFLGVSQQFRLAKANIEATTYNKALINIKTGEDIVEQYMNILNKTLNIIGNANIKYTCVKLEHCIWAAINQVTIPEDSNIKIEFNTVGENIIVYGDERHLMEAFLNILLNAVEALERKKGENPLISIETFVKDGLVQIEVEDNGVGIAKKALKKIFTPFYSSKSGVSGGVGLSYVANVIKQHHGKIRVKSALGEYTVFQIVLSLYDERRKNGSENKSYYL